MSKRLLLKSVLFVSTVGPVVASYAADNIANQEPKMFTQGVKESEQRPSSNNELKMPQHKAADSLGKDSNQGSVSKTPMGSTKAEESEEMD